MMGRLLRTFGRLLGVTITVGLVQAVIETALIAILYRDLLFAPYGFFTIQIYDAFTKLYFAFAGLAPLPRLLESFAGQGPWGKLALLPDLAAINVFVAVLLAIVLTPLARLVGLRADLRRRSFALRAVALVVVVCVGVHVVDWAMGVKIPLDPTFAKVATNLARNAVFEGVLIALAVTVAAAAVTLLLSPPAASVLAGAVVAAVLVAGPSADAAGGTKRSTLAQGTESRAAAAGYSVIFISIDSLRADRLGAYGHVRDTSPVMDRIAREGARFTHCSSTTSWTLPAHMSMLTGRSLLGHGVVADDRSLDPSVPTMAEAMRNAGYTTHAIVSAPYLNSRYGFAKGFDDYDDRTIAFETNEASYKTVTAPLLVRSATEWLQGHAEKPFFLFLHFWDVHYDYAPGPPYDRMFDPGYEGEISGDDFYFNPAVNRRMDPRDLEHILALYDGEIRLVDDQIGRLLAAVDRLGIADRTLIVITSDHGDEFFEHGHKGHHRTLYEEVLAVPCLIRAPGIPARTIAHEANIIDLMPTVLGLTGVPVPDGVEGVDWSPAIGGEEASLERTVFGELYRKGALNVQVAALAERGKVIHHFNVRRMETYDLEADPTEKVPLPNTEGIGAELASLMRDWLDRRWRAFGRREQAHGVQHLEIDEKTTEMLRSLGYVE